MMHSPLINSPYCVRAGHRRSRAIWTTQGFTLLELVVALSVFALGLTGVVSLNNNALLATANAARMQEASYLAERYLATLQLAEDLEGGDYAGTFQGLSQSARYPWQLRVNPLDSTPLQPQLRGWPSAVNPLELHLVVTAGEDSRPLEFYSLVLMPSAPPIDPQDPLGAKSLKPSRLGDRLGGPQTRVRP